MESLQLIGVDVVIVDAQIDQHAPLTILPVIYFIEHVSDLLTILKLGNCSILLLFLIMFVEFWGTLWLQLLHFNFTFCISYENSIFFLE
jgi:hypothetical protein